MVDFPIKFLPSLGITDDLVLNALYGGVLSGVGFGLVYRGRGTSGGSDILARILNHRRGIPIAQSYLFTDAAIILLAGFSFGWENALYAMVMLYVSGLSAETISEGVKVARTALIVTAQPKVIKNEILNHLGRGVTMLSGQGGYTDQARPVLYCVLTRTEVSRLKALVSKADKDAFMVIGHAYEALGEGFEPLDD